MVAPAERPTSPGRDAAALFGCFAVLLAASVLLHQLWWNGFEVLSPRFLVVLAALWSLLRPTSVGRFLTMLAAEVGSLALEMPAVHSHKLLVLVSGTCVLAFAATRSLRTRRLPSPGELFTSIAPFLRVQMVVVYLAAALSKLNTGFFDAATSCAVGLSAGVAWFDPSLLDADWRVAPAIWGTVLIELALPVLLLVPRTRLAGLLLGGGFHAILALAGNVPFSALALAYYVAFLPADAPARIREMVRARPGLSRSVAFVRRLARSRGAFPLAAGAWLAAAAALPRNPGLGSALVANGTRLLVVAAVLAAGAVLLRCLIRGGPLAHAPRSLRLAHPVFAFGIAVLVLNSASPYIGFKTESSFAMFSNLQTEPGRWNHLLIPEAVRVLPYQDDLVRIVATSDPALRRRARGGRLLVRYELERYLRLRPSTEVSFATAAGIEVVTRAGSGRSASPATWLLDRVAKFRDVRPLGRPGC